jgi:predicted nucleic acid-binding protein
LSKKKVVAKPAKERLVIDSSVAIAWCFPDEQDAYSQSVLDALGSERAIVLALWHLEVANTLLVGERRKRSTQANTVTWLGFLASLPIAVDEETKLHAFGNTVSLAREHNLSAYDAAYPNGRPNHLPPQRHRGRLVPSTGASRQNPPARPEGWADVGQRGQRLPPQPSDAGRPVR